MTVKSERSAEENFLISMLLEGNFCRGPCGDDRRPEILALRNAMTREHFEATMGHRSRSEITYRSNL